MRASRKGATFCDAPWSLESD